MTLRTIGLAALAGLLVFAGVVWQGQRPRYSELWGRNGERWDPTGRLPDYSFAGYHRGERGLPAVSGRQVDIRTFGAKGDGTTDDTDAFARALREVDADILLIPQGRYLLSDQLIIDRSRLVVRGAGSEKTVLCFTRPLSQMLPGESDEAADGDCGYNRWSWSGGLVTFRGEDAGLLLATVTAVARRGTTTLLVAGAEELTKGQLVVIRQTDTPERSLLHYLYAGDPGDISEVPIAAFTDTSVKIVGIQGNRLTIDRPLPVDIDPAWNPQIHSTASGIQESGIESLTIEFPATAYDRHGGETGWNGIAFESGTCNCWIRDITIRNADSGIFLGGRNNTVQGLTLVSGRPSQVDGEFTGHHGIYFRGQDNLLRDFSIETRFIHDLTVAEYVAGNVAMDGRAVKLSIDFHRIAPHSNLFTAIDAGYASRFLRRTGGRKRGKNAGAWNTIWNLRNATTSGWPQPRVAPSLFTIVGVGMSGSPPVEEWWYEDIPPRQLQPENLYKAQLRKRGAGGREQGGKEVTGYGG